MKSRVLIVALIGALTLGLYVTVDGQAGGQAAPTKVAVVNLQDIINDCAQQTKFRADNQARAESLQSEQQKRQKEIEGLTTAIDPLQPGSDAWMKKRDELQQKTLELRVWAEMQQQNSQREQARQFAAIYKAATDASATVAEAMGYEIVLQTGALPDLMRLDVQQLQTVVQTRKVVYAGKNIDITQAVLQRVNAQFDQR